MTSTAARLFALVLASSGCCASLPDVAPTTIALRAQGDLLLRSWRPAYGTSASIALEQPDCCGIGAFISYVELPTKGDDKRGASLSVRDATPDDRFVRSIITGGAELSAELPWSRKLEFRLRAGLAGTPPTAVSLGRRGFGASVSAVYQLARTPSESDATSPELNLVAGCSFWSLGASETNAGPNESSAAGSALTIGLELGARHGLDLQ